MLCQISASKGPKHCFKNLEEEIPHFEWGIGRDITEDM